MSLPAQLRQRKLVQWALAYAAAAFALLQGVDLVAQRFDWSPTLSRALIIVAIAGFFATLVLAWYHGERGAQKPVRSEVLLLGRDDEAARVLAPFDTPESLYALSSFMIYPKFDARRYPVLLAHLARQGLRPRPVTPEPYNCPPGSTSP